MTKLEELKAAWSARNEAWAAYKAELKKPKMTKREELKAAWEDAYDAWEAADAAYVDAAEDAYAAVWDAYYDELEKTPREPVEDEGNPLV